MSPAHSPVGRVDLAWGGGTVCGVCIMARTARALTSLRDSGGGLSVVAEHHAQLPLGVQT